MNSERHGPWRLGSVPGLDGLRGLAVLAVVAFHTGAASGGFLGVEVFFVLSGFLITSLLLQSSDQHRTIDLVAFYRRRFWRLTPPLVVVLSATCLAAAAGMSSLRQASLATVSTLGYFANWINVGGQEFGPLGHMWSLSIEEQFYFAWPLVLALVCRLLADPRQRAVYLFGISVCMFLFGSYLRIGLVGDTGWFDRVYYATDTRSPAILAGCAAACLLRLQVLRSGRSRMAQVGIVGAWLMLLAMLLLGAERSQMTYTVLLPWFDIVCCVVLLALATGTDPLRMVISFGPLRYMGRISYGVYLWHLPILVATNGLPDGMREAAQILTPVMLAAAMYRYVEVPLQSRFGRGSARIPDKGHLRPDPSSKPREG